MSLERVKAGAVGRRRAAGAGAALPLADALTIHERFGSLRGLKVAFIGDGNNVATSLAHICAKLGADFVLAAPEGYHLPAEVIALAKQFGAETGAAFAETTDPVAAVSGAHVVYTDTWTSMGQEAEAKEREKVFPPYQVNAALLAHARATWLALPAG